MDHPAAGVKLSLGTDVSTTHVGAVIQKKPPGSGWRPLGLFSAQLDKAQTNYSIFNMELLAVVAAIKHVLHMLEGRQFVLFTDHKPLVGGLDGTRIRGQLANSDSCLPSLSLHPASGTSPASRR
jgi:ribonuclease HI